MNQKNLPQVIILYGPPAAGKGTQASFLCQKLPQYYHLDFGTELRKFMNKHLGDYSSDQEVVNPESSPEEISIARSIKKEYTAFLPVKSEDLRYVVESAFVENIKIGRGMIVEGPGRLVEEAKWLSGFFAQKSVSVAILHLHLELEEAIRRSTNRYYIKSSKKSFKSYDDAKAEAKDAEEPYQRTDDTDIEGIKTRFRELYSQHYAEIISIYQLEAKSRVFTLDASKPIEKVTKDMLKYFEVFYGVIL